MYHELKVLVVFSAFPEKIVCNHRNFLLRAHSGEWRIPVNVPCSDSFSVMRKVDRQHRANCALFLDRVCQNMLPHRISANVKPTEISWSLFRYSNPAERCRVFLFANFMFFAFPFSSYFWVSLEVLVLLSNLLAGNCASSNDYLFSDLLKVIAQQKRWRHLFFFYRSTPQGSCNPIQPVMNIGRRSTWKSGLVNKAHGWT